MLRRVMPSLPPPVSLLDLTVSPFRHPIYGRMGHVSAVLTVLTFSTFSRFFTFCHFSLLSAPFLDHFLDGVRPVLKGFHLLREEDFQHLGFSSFSSLLCTFWHFLLNPGDIAGVGERE